MLSLLSDTLHIIPYSFFFRFIYLLLDSQIYREEERQRKIFLLLIHCWSGHNDWSWANLKPGASSRSPTQVQGPKALSCPWLLSQATIKEPDVAGIWTKAQMGPQHLQGEDFRHEAIVPGPIPYSSYTSLFMLLSLAPVPHYEINFLLFHKNSVYFMYKYFIFM